jgi:hypothetical protein
MPEIPNQRRSGTSMTERDCFQNAIFHLSGLRDCLRGLALEDAVKRMMTRRQHPMLILPPR